MSKMLKIVLAVSILSVFLTGCVDEVGDKYVSFAKCLTSKNVKMYGAYWCSHCQNQKDMFGILGAENINYIECDPRGENAKPEICLKKKITSYPTWELPGGKIVPGELTFQDLADATGCALPAEPTEPAK